MANFIKSTDFSVKDDLITGDPDKRIKGVEIDEEFDAIAIAVATKADLFSPNFLGVPTAATASPGVNNTQLATTAFATTVASSASSTAITNERTATATLTNKTLTSPTLNAPVITNSGTITLPTGTRTLVARDTTDTLTNKTVSLASNTVTGTKAEFNTTVTDTDFAFTNDFTGANQSLSSNGYQKLPGGLTIQWGRTSLNNNTSTTISFPTAFTNPAYAVTINHFGENTGDDRNALKIVSTSTTSFVVRNTNGYAGSSTWIAIGY
jgi:hypothetical protein